MKIFVVTTFIINILAVLVLLFGLFKNFESPKDKAVYGYVITGSMFLYMAFLSLFILLETIFYHNFIFWWLFLCILSPFIIGKFVKYDTLKKYTVIQILCFAISLVPVGYYAI